MVVVMAKIRAKPEHADEVAGHFHEMVDWVALHELATITYSCNRSTAEPSEFVFFERYPDSTAFDAHSKSERFAQLVGQLQGKLMAAPEVVMMEEVAAKI